jgi:acyl-CoA reductase-like NAD-dependent aldehyde dehydrogenase
MNPVNDYLGKHLETIFAPLVDEGFVRFAYGAADVGAALCDNGEVDSVHITGSARTHDTIVFGSGEDAAERNQSSDPILAKPISSELGGVGATIVVPGPWDDGDIAYQAENLATMKLHNAGFNCIALQVVVLPESWERTVEVEDALAQTIRSLEPREPYYPGAGDRLASLVAGHPDAEQLDQTSIPRTLVRGVDPADTADACFTTEAFGGTMATTHLPVADVAAYLQAAVEFCNDTLDGTLGIQLLVHPETMAELGPVLDSAIADLRYGTIGVNCWNGVGYLLQRTPWGAYPGHTISDVGSGIGVVHNTYMLENTEKSVVRGPFRTFPRSVGHAELHLATKPPWFVTNRNAAVIGERLTRFAANPGLARLAALFPPALTG